MAPDETFEGVHCKLVLRRPCPGVVVLQLSGIDSGELGRAPFEALQRHLATAAVDIFIDARHARSASVEVSNDWASFFRAHRQRIRGVLMLTTTRFLRMSAEMVRNYAMLDERMEIFTHPAEFERRLGERVLA